MPFQDVTTTGPVVSFKINGTKKGSHISHAPAPDETYFWVTVEEGGKQYTYALFSGSWQGDPEESPPRIRPKTAELAMIATIKDAFFAGRGVTIEGELWVKPSAPGPYGSLPESWQHPRLNSVTVG